MWGWGGLRGKRPYLSTLFFIHVKIFTCTPVSITGKKLTQNMKKSLTSSNSHILIGDHTRKNAAVGQKFRQLRTHMHHFLVSTVQTFKSEIQNIVNKIILWLSFIHQNIFETSFYIAFDRWTLALTSSFVALHYICPFSSAFTKWFILGNHVVSEWNICARTRSKYRYFLPAFDNWPKLRKVIVPSWPGIFGYRPRGQKFFWTNYFLRMV